MPSRAVAACAVALTLTLTLAAGAGAGEPSAALPAPAALVPLSRGERIERHTAETLWERINGEAELYRGYGLSSSAHALYEHPADPDRRVDLSVFAFADPLGAFGMFAAFRPPECEAQPLGNGGCLGDYQGFFWHGGTFVLADAAGPAAERPGDLRRALDATAALLGPAPRRPAPLSAFSRLVDTRTIRYQPQHLLGREALPPGLEGLSDGTAVFAAFGTWDLGRVSAVLDAYARVLTGAERSERNGFQTLAGVDPALGPVSLAGNARGIFGARAAPGAPGLQELLEALGGPWGDPPEEGVLRPPARP